MKKVLYSASTTNHLITFHIPYIEKLKEKYDVKIMSKDEDFKFADFNINFTKKLLSFKHIKTINQIAEVLRRENFDAIILNTSLASFLIRCAIKKLKTKPVVINIVHGYFFSKKANWLKNSFYMLAEKCLKKQTDYIITMNNEDFECAKKYKLAKKGVFKIDGMGIDKNRINIKKCDFSVKEKEPKFLFIGELSKRKNQEFLIKFIYNLKKYNYSAKLDLVGVGDCEQRLKELIKKYNLENQVKLVGYDRNIQKHLKNCDYYICASKIEGMPFNILEAMLAGCVILSSDIKGSVDIIKDFETGILFKLNNMKDLIDKFRLINEDEKLKMQLSKNAINLANNYLMSNVFDVNIKLVEGLIEKNDKK